MTFRLQCTLTNESSKTLTLVELKTERGKLISEPPEPSLGPKETTTWVVETDGDLSGWALYKVDAGGDWSMFECGFKKSLGDPVRGWTTHRLPSNRAKSPNYRSTSDAEDNSQLKYRFVMPNDGPTQPTFQAYDVRNVKLSSGTTTHVSLPGNGRGAMLCPKGDYAKLRNELKLAIDAPGTAHLQEHKQNRVFAEQWQRVDEKTRKLFELGATATFEDFLSTAKEAAEWVAGGEVILFVGHGGAGGVTRVQTAFDTTPEAGGMSTHKNLITETLVCDFEEANEKKDGNWQRKSGATKVIDARHGDEDVQTLGAKWEGLGRLGVAFERAKLVQFTILSCNVGSDSRGFVGRLAQRLRCKVRAYTQYVQLGDYLDDKGPREQIWLEPIRGGVANRPEQPTPAGDPSFHAIPATSTKIADRSGREVAL